MQITNRFALSIIVLLFAALYLPLHVSAAEDNVHKIVFHIDDSDPQRMNLVLNNVANVNKYYQDKGEPAQIEIVAYGPGLTMLVAAKSPVKDRVKSIADSFDNVEFKACANTLKAMTKKAGKDIKLLPQAKMVESGVIHLVERQEQGWSYIRP
jgi:intracellular sulfur oxidation DsrE/DsrF family protein